MMIEMKVILGGVLLGIATGVMLLFRGKILGCSGYFFVCGILKTINLM